MAGLRREPPPAPRVLTFCSPPGEVEANETPSVVGRLTAGDAAAPAEFLECYAPLILQVARRFEHDEDRLSECFLFVCEGLRRRGYRRLRRFRPGGAASFDTWLKAVVRNLCLDWRRARFGRRVLPSWVVKLPPLDREAYRLLNHQGLTLDETRGALLALFPRLSTAEFLAAVDRLAARRGRIGPRRELRPRVESLSTTNPTGDAVERAVEDPAPGPEEVAARRERAARLGRELAGLSPRERLLLRLRFEQELTLAETARLAGLANPQAADREIRRILATMRIALDPPAEGEGGESV